MGHSRLASTFMLARPNDWGGRKFVDSAIVRAGAASPTSGVRNEYLRY
jgi:hypothetical protein